ncbi:elongator complex protein 5 isoform X3 [Ascaphus truei]|uniref:elongator complex protein 5 isoform X3 n=1 Tax=Ascaphus truei TaxID=8439 RepID=UPI003F5ABC58
MVANIGHPTRESVLGAPLWRCDVESRRCAGEWKQQQHAAGAKRRRDLWGPAHYRHRAAQRRDLLKSFVQPALQRGESVHVFGYEVGRDEYAEGFTPQVLSSMTFHDGFSDPLRWIGVASSLTPQDFTASGILGRLGDSCHPVTIVLDSLSWVLARSPLPSVCHTLRGLTQGKHGAGPRVTRVLALLHTDLHTPGVLRSVCLLAGTVIHVSERGPRDRVTVTHRKRTGKVVTTGEEFTIHDGFSVETFTEQEAERRRRAEADPTANLTFNLRLSEADRELKDSASLPYTFTESKKSSLLHSSSSSGRIFYDPDPADDYDDEDPDDDLDV